MKERWSFSKEKLISAEEGLKPTEPVTGRGICSCDRLIQYAKLVLYIELILFLGWSSYTLWQAYDQQTDIRFFNVFPSKYAVLRDIESSTVPTEVLKPSALKDFKDTLDEIKTTENSLSVEQDFITHHFETTTTNEELKSSLESSNSDEDKEIIVKVPRLNVFEPKKPSSSEDGSVIEWDFPLLWNIHKEIGPFTDDFSEAVSESKFDEGFKHLYESNENDDSNDLSEFRQTSSEKETEQQSDNEKSAISKDVSLSMEILNNLEKILKSIKDVPRDEVWGDLDDYDFLESSDDSKEDEISLNSPKPSLYDWTWDTDDFMGPSAWGESTESSIVFPNSSDKEESDNFPAWLARSESEEFDSPEKVTSDSKSDNWDLQLSSEPTTDGTDTNQAQITTNWTRLYSNPWMDSMDESTERNRETSTEVISEEDNISDRDQMWPLSFSWHHDTATPLQVDNVDSEASTTTINEENSSSERDQVWLPGFSGHHDTTTPLKMDNEDSSSIWHRILLPRFNLYRKTAKLLHVDDDDLEPFTITTNEEDKSPIRDRIREPIPSMYHNFLRSLQMESEDSEKETVQFGPRIKHEDSAEREACTVQFVNGLRIMKCSWSSDDSDHSSDSSDTTESNSDNSTKSHVTFLGKNYGIFDKVPEEENVPDNSGLFDEKSDLYDSDMIDETEEELLKTSPSSEDSFVTSEAFKFGMSDTPASSTIEDSAVSSSEFDWHPPFEQTETNLDPEDSYVEKMNYEINTQDLPHKTKIIKKTIRRYANEDSDESMAKFYSTMEILSAHIDALHERYLREHQLEDDYISQELPNENYMKIENNNVSPAA